jgi:cobalt/nickel transport system permease protein
MAFIFTAQMINFTIPGTGSSGHLGGGMILAILLGPYAGFLTMASVLAVQALFFADGGLMALGCNIFNLGS